MWSEAEGFVDSRDLKMRLSQLLKCRFVMRFPVGLASYLHNMTWRVSQLHLFGLVRDFAYLETDVVIAIALPVGGCVVDTAHVDGPWLSWLGRLLVHVICGVDGLFLNHHGARSKRSGKSTVSWSQLFDADFGDLGISSENGKEGMKKAVRGGSNGERVGQLTFWVTVFQDTFQWALQLGTDTPLERLLVCQKHLR